MTSTAPAAAGSKRAKGSAGKSKGSRGDSDATTAATTASPTLVEFDWSEDDMSQARKSLLDWYNANHRVLPWRRTPNSTRTLPAPSGPHEGANPAPDSWDKQRFAYGVWVSEVMLQQTQVATVLPYYERWLAKWPTVNDLAAADIETVNAMWSGLGYYRRARYLLEGAQYVVNKLGGLFPDNPTDLLNIPGVGAYTSAAVSSIAFDHPTAVVDGNVIRVMSRLKALPGDPTKLGAAHTRLAQQLIDTDKPGDWNQAVMELGARVCKPQAPDCAGCPLSAHCAAHKQWQDYLSNGGCADVEDAPRVTNYPGKKEVKAKKEQTVAVCVLEVVGPSAPTTHTTNLPSTPATSTGTDKAAQETAQAADKGQETAAKPAGSQDTVAAAGKQPAQQQQGPKKRQATLFDFVSVRWAAKKAATGKEAGEGLARTQDGDKAAASTGTARDAAAGAGGVAVPSTAVLSRLLAQPTNRHVLLVQRPEGGLLAGLWELPGVELDDPSPSLSDRRTAVNALLTQLLTHTGVRVQGLAADDDKESKGKSTAEGTSAGTSAGAGEGGIRGQEKGSVPPAVVVRRHDAGTYTHVFSHIRQLNYVERVVLYTPDPTAFMAAVTSTTTTNNTNDTKSATQPTKTAPAKKPKSDKKSGSASAKASKAKANGTTLGDEDADGGDMGEDVDVASAGARVSTGNVRWVRGDVLLQGGDGVSAGPIKMFKLATGAAGKDSETTSKQAGGASKGATAKAARGASSGAKGSSGSAAVKRARGDE